MERLRWTTPTTEPENRLSRMCMADVETPEQVLSRCIGDKNSVDEWGSDEEKATVVRNMQVAQQFLE